MCNGEGWYIWVGEKNDVGVLRFLSLASDWCGEKNNCHFTFGLGNFMLNLFITIIITWMKRDSFSNYGYFSATNGDPTKSLMILVKVIQRLSPLFIL